MKDEIELITDSERVLFNQTYLDKLANDRRKALNQYKDEMPDYLVEYLKEMENNPFTKISNDKIRELVEYLADPKNSQSYKEQIVFKPQHMIGEIEDDKSPNQFNICIPLFSTTF